MKLTSTFKKLVNSYPITLIFILLLLSSITAIFIQSHVYAMSEKSNTPGCDLVPHPCPVGTTEGKKCSTQKVRCYCMTKKVVRCLTTYYYTCEGTTTGCLGSRPCEESDCDFGGGCGNGSYPKKCGPCIEYTPTPDNECPGGIPSVSCDVDCNFTSRIIDTYTPEP